jgi:hypothetical protein
MTDRAAGLSKNGIRLPHKAFLALCRFVDKDLDRSIDLHEFKAVLIGKSPHPSDT